MTHTDSIENSMKKIRRNWLIATIVRFSSGLVCYWSIAIAEPDLFNEWLDNSSISDVLTEIVNSISKQLPLGIIAYFALKRSGTKLLDFTLIADPIFLVLTAIIHYGGPQKLDS